MVRSRMTHRALVERNVTAATQDAYGNEQAATWVTHIAAQPCYWYQPSNSGGEQQGERNVRIYTQQMLTPWEVDITEGDRINGIKDRRGDDLTTEVFNVVAIVYKPDHLLLTLEVVK
jgi:hypothetical protein